MRNHFFFHAMIVGTVSLASIALGQDQSPTPTPQPSVTPTGASVLVAVPSPSPSASASATLPPGDVLPLASPQPTANAQHVGAVEASSSFNFSEKGAPVFTVDKAVITALMQNPTVLNALQEIERSKGVIIEIRAQALPHITPNASFQWTDPHLGSAGGGIVGGGGGG
jgi:hypothetical protein